MMSNMTFRNRLSGRMAESIVRALLEHARYRIIDSGIECLIREVSVMDRDEYNDLNLPEAIKALPDFTVLDRDQKAKWLVEVKYRETFNLQKIVSDVEHQVRLFNELTVALVIANPPGGDVNAPARHLRGFRLRLVDEQVEVELRLNGVTRWYPSADVKDAPWWSTKLLQDIFPQLNEQKEEKTIAHAVELIAGLVRTSRA